MPAFYINGSQVQATQAIAFVLRTAEYHGHHASDIRPLINAACLSDGEEARDCLAELVNELEIIVWPGETP